MINAYDWIVELTDKLKIYFQGRLLFVGLQGSYQRQEAYPGSDIDAVVILDILSMDDLKAYREILSTMPHNDQACGFIAGRQELMNWPRHELFQFKQDTRPCYGILDELLPPLTRQDIINGVKIGACGLYHACCHSAVHNPNQISAIRGLCKSAFFLLQAIHFLSSGEYIHSKQELFALLEGDERELVRISMNWDACSAALLAEPDTYFELLLGWSGKILNSEF